MVYLVRNKSNNNLLIGKEKLAPGKEKTIVGDEIKKYKILLEKDYITITKLGDEIIIDNMDIPANVPIIETPKEIVSEEKKLTIENKVELNLNKDYTQVLDNCFIKENLKQNLIESFFNYYLTREISTKELNLLKWFYKNVGFTNGVSNEALNLLDTASCSEELTEILLNNIYPELLDNYLSKEDQTKNKEL